MYTISIFNGILLLHETHIYHTQLNTPSLLEICTIEQKDRFMLLYQNQVKLKNEISTRTVEVM